MRTFPGPKGSLVVSGETANIPAFAPITSESCDTIHSVEMSWLDGISTDTRRSAAMTPDGVYWLKFWSFPATEK